MNSFDIFDTLIGRWYKEQDSVFYEIERVYGFKDFVWWRKHNEEISRLKTFDDIYNQEWPKEFDVKYLKTLEFDLELARTFRIAENADKLTKDSILISDTYYSKSQLMALLDKCGIYTYKDIYCGPAIKSSGSIWKKLGSEIDLHTGDNKFSDIEQASAHGIKTSYYTGHNFTDNEAWANSHGFPYLARLMRMLRLTCPVKDNLAKVWVEQSQVNLPILVLLSNYFNTREEDLLFTSRDCHYLYRIFKTRFGNHNAKLLESSRLLYNYPTNDYIDYVKDTYTHGALIVDLQGTGNSSLGFFNKLGISPKIFMIVNADTTLKNKIEYFVRRVDGYTDYIERVNYFPSSSRVVFDQPSVPLGDVNIKTINDFQWKAVTIICADFELETHFDKQLLVDFLNYLEKNCVIKDFVNHEAV